MNSNGYAVIKVDSVTYKAHRLAWLCVHGEWPAGQIDHINGSRTDNRIANLRDVPHLINAQNRRRANRNNSTGLLGVSHGKAGGYVATICVGSKTEYLGVFSSAEEAHQMYLLAKRQKHLGATI